MTQFGTPTTAYALSGGGTRVTLDWAGATDVGRRRQHNEDSFIAEAPLFVVADGMGGHSAGDVASDAVVRRLRDAGLSSPTLSPVLIEEALQQATEDIMVAAKDNELGAGTTVTGAFLSEVDGEAGFTVFNVGDSRVYLLDGSSLRQVTVDHSVVQEMVDAGLLHPDDMERHPDSNVITRAVGFDADPQPDYWTIPATPGMRLLVCSDGLTKELAPVHIAAILGAVGDTAEAATSLVDAAVEAGGRDNVTAVVVDVRGTDEVGTVDGAEAASAE